MIIFFPPLLTSYKILAEGLQHYSWEVPSMVLLSVSWELRSLKL